MLNGYNKREGNCPEFSTKDLEKMHLEYIKGKSKKVPKDHNYGIRFIRIFLQVFLHIPSLLVLYQFYTIPLLDKATKQVR